MSLPQLFIQNQWKTADFLLSLYYGPQLSQIGQVIVTLMYSYRQMYLHRAIFDLRFLVDFFNFLKKYR